MDRWYLGESAEPHPPTFSDSDAGVHPITFKCTPSSPGVQEKQKQGEAGFLDKGISVWVLGVLSSLLPASLNCKSWEGNLCNSPLSVCVSTCVSVHLQEL